MDYVKKNFVVGEKVKFVRTNSELDNIEGVVLGCSMHHIMNHYIVGELSKPLTDRDDRAINITEACLERV